MCMYVFVCVYVYVLLQANRKCRLKLRNFNSYLYALQLPRLASLYVCVCMSVRVYVSREFLCWHFVLIQFELHFHIQQFFIFIYVFLIYFHSHGEMLLNAFSKQNFCTSHFINSLLKFINSFIICCCGKCAESNARVFVFMRLLQTFGRPWRRLHWSSARVLLRSTLTAQIHFAYGLARLSARSRIHEIHTNTGAHSQQRQHTYTCCGLHVACCRLEL